MLQRSDWTTRLAVLGAVAGCAVAAKVARQLYLWAELALGPVRVKRFNGEWALVTGGSEGVGKAVAASLASNGLHIIMVSRSKTKLDAAASEIKVHFPLTQVRTIATDLTAPGSCQQLLQQLSDTPITVLIANVGGGACGPMVYWEYTDEDEAYVQALNGQACYSLVKGLLPSMIERNKGAIVAVSSIMHKWGAYAAPYSAEKAKMNALMTALDSELRLAGADVTAQAMVLGPVKTPGVTKLMQTAVAAAAARRAATQPAAVAAASGSGSNEAGTQPKKAPAVKERNQPSAEHVAAAMVRCIGKGGPVVTPYWGHVMLEQLVLGECLWPPALRRAVSRTVSRKFKVMWEGGVQ